MQLFQNFQNTQVSDQTRGENSLKIQTYPDRIIISGYDSEQTAPLQELVDSACLLIKRSFLTGKLPVKNWCAPVKDAILYPQLCVAFATFSRNQELHTHFYVSETPRPTLLRRINLEMADSVHSVVDSIPSYSRVPASAHTSQDYHLVSRSIEADEMPRALNCFIDACAKLVAYNTAIMQV